MPIASAFASPRTQTKSGGCQSRDDNRNSRSIEKDVGRQEFLWIRRSCLQLRSTEAEAKFPSIPQFYFKQVCKAVRLGQARARLQSNNGDAPVLCERGSSPEAGLRLIQRQATTNLRRKKE
jgi:hypothetical protein